MIGKLLRWAVVLALLVILISGSVAFYTVFFGGKDLVVPPLREMSVLDAVESAERMGFEVKIEQVDSSVPAGTVLAQWPDPGAKVRRDKTVILKVSKGGNRRALSDLRGMEQKQAARAIEEQGFVVGEVLRIHDDARPAGSVVAQNPASPAMVEGDRKIDLLVSMGPVPRDGKIPVPDIAQRDEGTARELLQQAGLRVGGVEYVNTQQTPSGMVMGTKPKAGAMVRQGDPIVIQVAAAKRKEPEPTPESRPVQPVTPDATSAVIVEQPRNPVSQIGPAGPVRPMTPEQQELAGHFRIKSIPTVFAMVGGRPVDQFQGALPEPEVRQYLDELMRVAEANGVTGRIDPDDAPWFIDAILLPAFRSRDMPRKAQNS